MAVWWKLRVPMWEGEWVMRDNAESLAGYSSWRTQGSYSVKAGLYPKGQDLRTRSSLCPDVSLWSSPTSPYTLWVATYLMPIPISKIN